MAITNYVHENIAGTGLKWHPVTDEGDVLYYPCGENLEDVKAQQEFIDSWAEEGVSVF